jgi:t-SNARE complex subunit (syntaxin)
VLVYAQGEKIDSIEANIATANYEIKEGEGKLKKAKKHHK